MIRKNIEPGTEVFHEFHGIGKVIEPYGDKLIKIKFENTDEPTFSIIDRTKLIEIDETFNPPV